MAKDRSYVRASDIGAWVYCRRAWWLANVQGAQHEHPGDLARGVVAHESHGRGLLFSQRARYAGMIALTFGCLLLIATALLWLFTG